MTLAQASIHRLFEQVRTLEAEAARRGPRRRGHRAVVLLAAAAIGAVSAGVSHPGVRRAQVHAPAAVAHLTDTPAERKRALGHRAPQRPHRTRRVPVPVLQRPPAVTPPAPAADASSVAAPDVRATAPAVDHLPVSPVPAPGEPHHALAPAAHRTAAHRTAAHPTAAPATPPRRRLHPQPAVTTVGIGPVVVTTTEEPQPDPAGGASPATAP